ncbi:hypothetical protein SELMODRAFT_431540 [Selaginella moellendorffii]|uniref:DCD domain-containing protein n=1 Tax=Selaginella moellendorffii TaxID=88036 RepID=D8TD00_SELML|nr:hypothetical protein SELMODRAFT_431540 [Selaginella moellendorffii]
MDEEDDEYENDDEKMMAPATNQFSPVSQSLQEFGHTPDGSPDMSVRRSERAMLMGFLAGFIERFKLVSLLPGADTAGDSSISMSTINDGYEILKAMMLDNASLVLRPFHRGAKPSKFGIEAKWLRGVFSKTLQEVEEHLGFSNLDATVEEGERRERHLPKALEKIRQLTHEMHELRQSLQSEAATHKVMEREWNKTLLSLKQAIKDLKKENKIQAKFRADVLSATADCNRRDRDIALRSLRDHSDRLKSKIEVEKKITNRCLEFVKNQNLQLMEEAINLQAGLELDMVQMDLMIKKIREQRNDKQIIIDELEPRYIEKMAKRKMEEEEIDRKKNVTIEQQGLNEMRLRATMKIQRIYRGFKSRLGFKKELKKWKKKQKKDGKKAHDHETASIIACGKPVMKGTHPSPRDSHSSTAVRSKLYVFGGTDGTSTLDDLFVLDNATNTWGKPDVFGDVPAPRGHSASLIGDNLFVFGGYTFVWKKISTTGVSPIPWDSHTCSSYKNCFVVMGGEDSGNPETMAWREVKTTGAELMPGAGHTTISHGKYLACSNWCLGNFEVPGLLHVSPLQEIPWMQSEAYYSSMRDVTKSLKLWMTCISLLLTLLPFLTIWLPFFCEEMLREKDPSEPKLSMRKERKRRRQKYHATPFVLDKQRDADKSLVSSHGGICGKPWTSPIFPCQTHPTEFQPLGEKMFEARESDVFNYRYILEASIDGKLFRGLLFSYKPGFAQAVQSYMARKENITGGNHRTSKRP